MNEARRKNRAIGDEEDPEKWFQVWDQLARLKSRQSKWLTGVIFDGCVAPTLLLGARPGAPAPSGQKPGHGSRSRLRPATRCRLSAFLLGHGPPKQRQRDLPSRNARSAPLPTAGDGGERGARSTVREPPSKRKISIPSALAPFGGEQKNVVGSGDREEPDRLDPQTEMVRNDPNSALATPLSRYSTACSRYAAWKPIKNPATCICGHRKAKSGRTRKNIAAGNQGRVVPQSDFCSYLQGFTYEAPGIVEIDRHFLAVLDCFVEAITVAPLPFRRTRARAA